MLILLKSLECYTPRYIGRQDILLCSDKICKIQPHIPAHEMMDAVYDCQGLYAFPGILDQHVHILGGGGEEGFASHIPEAESREFFQGGITTVVGLLGADRWVRNLDALYGKAKALEAEGLTTYIYIGSYTVPPVTFTGEVIRDMVLVDKVIGVKTAISDHRGSCGTEEELIRLASQAHLGGMLGGKAGVVHLHLGDEKEQLKPLLKIIEKSDLPIEQFVPTHLNRSRELFRQAVEYCKAGGNIDLTAGETEGISVPEAVKVLTDENIGLSGVTVSSDGRGSRPGGGFCTIGALFEDIVRCIKDYGISMETAFGLVTENVAKVLKLYPSKGSLQPGSDADILITDRHFNIKKVFSKGILQEG